MARTAEELRLDEAREQGVAWRRWGPYLSERQWGTVREDYSDNGDAWAYSVAKLLQAFAALTPERVLSGDLGLRPLTLQYRRS